MESSNWALPVSWPSAATSSNWPRAKLSKFRKLLSATPLMVSFSGVLTIEIGASESAPNALLAFAIETCRSLMRPVSLASFKSKYSAFCSKLGISMAGVPIGKCSATTSANSMWALEICSWSHSWLLGLRKSGKRRLACTWERLPKRKFSCWILRLRSLSLTKPAIKTVWSIPLISGAK